LNQPLKKGRKLKGLITIVLVAARFGCASKQAKFNFDGPDPAVVGDKPEGYPRTYIRPLPDFPGFCIKVTEDWKSHDHQGQTIWLREKQVKSLNCPSRHMEWQGVDIP